MAESGRRFSEHDVPMAEELARRMVRAIENARLYQQVQEALRTRDEFLAIAAHDLKSPLTSMKGLAQLLRRQVARSEFPGAERLMDGLGRIDATATKMAEQLDEILDLTYLQMGQRLELRRQPTDLIELVLRVAAEQQQTTERHQIRVETSLGELVGIWDSVRLARMLDNLLANAIKYSPEGGDIIVSVAREESDEGDRAVLVVQDQGLGIPASDLPRIFERFQRARNVAGRISGMGLGLASVRQIVEQHGGTIGVASVEGRGSAFTVRLPLQSRDDASASDSLAAAG